MATLTRVAPELSVDDVAESLRYYEAQLGFRLVMTMPAGDYAVVQRDGVALHLFASAPPARSPGSVHIFVAGLDELHAELQRRGARITQAIVRQPWGNRDFRALDPSGNVIKFTEPLDKPA
jgi:uncharacterized glyoxalase superfamily protein PhnB